MEAHEVEQSLKKKRKSMTLDDLKTSNKKVKWDETMTIGDQDSSSSSSSSTSSSSNVSYPDFNSIMSSVESQNEKNSTIPPGLLDEIEKLNEPQDIDMENIQKFSTPTFESLIEESPEEIQSKIMSEFFLPLMKTTLEEPETRIQDSQSIIKQPVLDVASIRETYIPNMGYHKTPIISSSIESIFSKCRFISKKQFDEENPMGINLLNINCIDNNSNKFSFIFNRNNKQVMAKHLLFAQYYTPYTLWRVISDNYSNNFEHYIILNSNMIGKLQKSHFEQDELFEILSRGDKCLYITFNRKLKIHPELVMVFGQFIILLFSVLAQKSTNINIYFINLDPDIHRLLKSYFTRECDGRTWGEFFNDFSRFISMEQDTKQYLKSTFNAETLTQIIRINYLDNAYRMFTSVSRKLKQLFKKMTTMDFSFEDNTSIIKNEFKSELNFLKELKRVIVKKDESICNEECSTIKTICLYGKASNCNIILGIEFSDENSKILVEFDNEKATLSQRYQEIILNLIDYCISDRHLSKLKRTLKKKENVRISINMQIEEEEGANIIYGYNLSLSNASKNEATDLFNFDSIQNKYRCIDVFNEIINGIIQKFQTISNITLEN